ncbi:acetyl-CoA carboxylase biotin carboxyl carrier protein subunit [Pallidibacillus pasinlerensis]|uniref:Acetyl-CoA carboxylase biotin carboxyl carrier protein subunit n=1 Tax=Pallidibacillus pasinlerensis TaxID=2703818 RepID=A0ABW9ZYL7_9BACI|nr:acetyl-CoA carboxylase biotin carboxyl carrier protein subunit [Pallidibacillus pasinlerensis]NCU16181.1 acetyl-CoA carboxylase biotin carboxyl carrier protein subunit [Pallidibacillus pasinlerensis]
MNKIQAEMAGTIFQVLVSEGEKVEEGQVVIVLESMKMEIPVESNVSGEIETIHVAEGDFVNEGDVLVTLR